MKGRRLLTAGIFIATISIFADGMPVTTMTLQTITPQDMFFTGKAMSTEGGNLAFDVGSGLISKTKKVGDVVFPNIYNADGSIAHKGSVVGEIVNDRQKASLEAAKLALQDAQDQYDRDRKSGQAITPRQILLDKINILTAKANLIKAQTDLEGTQLIAPYTGVITNVQRGPGMGVGGAGDDFATIARMDPIIVKVPFASEIVNFIDKDTLVKVYPLGSDEPRAAWVELNPEDQFSLYAFVENEVVPDLTWLTPEQLKLPRVYGLFPVRNFYDEQYLTKIEIEQGLVFDRLTPEDKTMIGVPEKAVFTDSEGDFIYRAKGQKAFSLEKGISLDFELEKVRVKKGQLVREFNFGSGAALTIVNLIDAGSLNKDDILCIYLDKGLKSGERVVYTRTRWLFLPGDQVKVEIPAIVQPGLYVPASAIIHAAESENYVYVVNGGTVKLVRVHLVGRAHGTYAIEGDGIKAGTQVVIIDDKSIYDSIYDGASVTVKGAIPPPTILEKKRALPLAPADSFGPYSFFR